MGGLFNPDNVVFNFINKLVDGIVLSIIWGICCIPIVTIGPACAALYYTVVKTIRRERGEAVREFFGAFRKNLKKGVIINLILLTLGAAVLATDVPLIIMLINSEKAIDTVALIVFLVKLFLLLGVAGWIYPLLSRFDAPILELGRTALFVMLRYLHVTAAVATFLIMALFCVYMEVFTLAAVPALTAFFMSMLMEPVLRTLVKPEELDPNADNWFMGR